MTMSSGGNSMRFAISVMFGSLPFSFVSCSLICMARYAVSRMERLTRTALLSRRKRFTSPEIIGTP